MSGSKKSEKKELAHRDKEPIEKGAGEPTRAGVYYSPAVDIYRDEEGLTLVADLPGVRKEDLDIDLKESVLTISAAVPELEDRFKPVYREYGVGGYMRSFTLSDKIDQAKISAQLRDGVLTVRLPKTGALVPRKISIGAA
jgi:HSP20 family molecular chaperone IbpA